MDQCWIFFLIWISASLRFCGKFFFSSISSSFNSCEWVNCVNQKPIWKVPTLKPCKLIYLLITFKLIYFSLFAGSAVLKWKVKVVHTVSFVLLILECPYFLTTFSTRLLATQSDFWRLLNTHCLYCIFKNFQNVLKS